MFGGVGPSDFVGDAQNSGNRIFRSGNHRSPSSRLHGIAVCRLETQSRRILCDGIRAHGAVAQVEELFQRIGGETADVAVGVLESRQLPPADLVEEIAARCNVVPDRLVLLVAPTASQAGTVQIVARSIETTIHKLLDLGFDVERIVSGAGIAPLPPVAANDLAGIGRTNDAILYGAQVTLWVRGDDRSLEAIAPRVPSCGSADYGSPFAEVFARYHHDFYQIDPHLFSPAAICFVNLDTGRSFRAGQVDDAILEASFGS